jgi:hypothetical protein
MCYPKPNLRFKRVNYIGVIALLLLCVPTWASSTINPVSGGLFTSLELDAFYSLQPGVYYNTQTGLVYEDEAQLLSDDQTTPGQVIEFASVDSRDEKPEVYIISEGRSLIKREKHASEASLFFAMAVCKDTTLYLDANGELTVLPEDVDGGSDFTDFDSWFVEPDQFTCADTGNQVVTLHIVDTNGDTSMCDATVTVLDSLPPVMACEGQTVYLDAMGMGVLDTLAAAGMTSDNCEVDSLDVTQGEFTCADTGQVTITLYAYDASGNVDSCEVIVTVQDTLPPVMVCEDVTVYLNDMGQGVLDTLAAAGMTSDNCGVDSLDVTQGEFDCTELGQVTITLYAYDASGNVDSCEVIVTVEDTIPPMMACMDQIVDLDNLGEGFLDTLAAAGTTSDNCGVDSFHVSQGLFVCPDIGSTSITLYAFDESGNVDSCAVNVTVQDTLAPIMLCQNQTVYLDDMGQGVLDTASAAGATTDNCGVDSLDVTQGEFTCSDTGQVTITLYAYDASGNVDSCEVIVTVQDTLPPVMACENQTVYLDDMGQGVLDTIAAAGMTTDNCGVDSLDVSRGEFNCSDLEEATITLYAYDASGNVDSCEVVVTVLDTLAPVMSCQDQMVFLDEDGIGVLDTLSAAGTSSDNCGIDSLDVTRGIFFCDDIGEVNITLYAWDASGNLDSCEVVVVTVQDTIPPVIECVDQTVYLDSNGEGILDTMAAAGMTGDNCEEITVDVSRGIFFCDDVGTPVTITLYATDEMGQTDSCELEVTVMDTLPPTMECADVTVSLDNTGMGVIDTMEAAGTTHDACGIESLDVSRGVFDCSDIGEVEVVLYATDVNGNTDSCDVIVTVVDEIPPSLFCPDDITLTLDSAHCDRAYCYVIDADDNCEGFVDTIEGMEFIGDFNGNHYFASLPGNEMSWEEANQFAAENGGTLVYIKSEPESDWIQSNYPVPMGGETFWIGGRHSLTFDLFKWNDGDEFDYENWALGQPGMGPYDRDFVYWNYTGLVDDGWYNTQDTTTDRRFFVELQAGRSIRLVSGIAPGNVFPVGITDVVYQVAEACGNMVVASPLTPPQSAPAPTLGAAADFAVFTGVGAFNNDGLTEITGDIGTNVGGVTGFPPGIVNGDIHVENTESSDAATATMNAYGELATYTCGQVIGTTLGNGQVLTPDIYCLGAASTINGVLTLDAEGDPNAEFIFLIDGALSTSTFAEVELINGASYCNVYWRINGAFSLAESAVFQGTALVGGAISLFDNSTVFGRTLATSGAVELHNTTVTLGSQGSAPTITANGPTSFCEGESVMLSGNTGGGIWNTGETTESITVTTSGEYFVLAGSCGSDTSNIIEVTVFQNHQVTCNFSVLVISDDQVVCTQQNISLDEECEAEVLAEMVLSGQVDCYDVYEVIVYDGNGVPMGNMVDSEDAGQILPYEVYDELGQFVCRNNILVEDKFPPVVTCRDTILNCIEMQQYNGPDVEEHCEGVEVRLVGETITPLQCDDEFIKEIIRAYVAEDAAGNISDTCFQEILIERFPLDSVEFPEEGTVVFECDDIAEVDQNGNPHPSITGVPTLYGVDIYPYNDFLCNVTVTYSDYVNPEVACVIEIFRTWEVTEWWCSEKRTRPFVQRIRIIDTTGPVVQVPMDMTVNTARRSCEATFILPPAQVNDACHNPVRVDVEYPGGFLQDQNGGLIQLTAGVHTIIFRAYDGCYNSTEDSMFVTVLDFTPPVAVCEQNLIVAVRQDGTAVVPAETFDDGSWDACGLGDFEVRRMQDACGVPGNTDWGPSVEFCCADVGVGPIMVGLRVFDIGGNEAQCMVQVEVQDKYFPTLIPLPDMTISCEYAIDTTRLFEFGKIATDPADRDTIFASNMEAIFSGPAYDGLASDNCFVTVEEDFSLELERCGLGVLRRFFTISDPQGATILDTQTITIVDYNPFMESNIEWPEDLDTIGLCDMIQLHPDSLPAEYGRPIINDEDACSQVGMSYVDRTFPAVQGVIACTKIFRVWTVIDWCQFDGREYERWEHEQVIKVENNIAPEIISGCQDTMICTFDPDCMDGFIALVVEGVDDCTPADQLHWEYEIDLHDDGSVDMTGTGNDASGHYPVGTHRIEWLLEDLCGNFTTCEHVFEIRNCKGPVVYCRNGLVVELEPVDTNGDGDPDDEQVEITPEELDLGSYHACGYEIFLSFSQDTSDKLIVYNCDSIGMRTVELWVTDENGNTGFCVLNVDVQDNNMVNICPAMTATAVVSGQLHTPKGSGIARAMVSFIGSGMPDSETRADGSFAFPAMPTGGVNYQVVPTKVDGVLEGVSTRDLLIIQRHLLGLAEIEDPYSLIAADVNNDQRITARDLIDLRRTILGMQPEFPNNRSWRFVDGNYSFPVPTNPWVEPFPEMYGIARLEQNESLEFVGVKIGDVDGTLGLTGTLNTRNAETVSLIVGEKRVIAGLGTVIPVSLSSEVPIEGLQFEVSFANRKQLLTNVVPADLWKSGGGLINDEKLMKGRLTGSWNTNAAPFSGTGEFFYIVLRMDYEDQIDFGFSIYNERIKSVAYDAQLNELDVRLEQSTTSDEMDLAVSPNPWSELLQVELHVPQTGDAILILFDAQGKQMWRRTERVLQKDMTTFIRRQSEWTSGLYHLVLVQGEQTVTRRIVISD